MISKKWMARRLLIWQSWDISFWKKGYFFCLLPWFPSSSTGQCPAGGSTGKSALIDGGPRSIAHLCCEFQQYFCYSNPEALKTQWQENLAYTSALHPRFRQTKAEGMRLGGSWSLCCIFLHNAKNSRLVSRMFLFSFYLALI